MSIHYIFSPFSVMTAWWPRSSRFGYTKRSMQWYWVCRQLVIVSWIGIIQLTCRLCRIWNAPCARWLFNWLVCRRHTMSLSSITTLYMTFPIFCLSNPSFSSPKISCPKWVSHFILSRLSSRIVVILLACFGFLHLVKTRMKKIWFVYCSTIWMVSDLLLCEAWLYILLENWSHCLEAAVLWKGWPFQYLFWMFPLISQLLHSI